MSIRWMRNVLIDGEKNTIEVQMGEHHMGDKCYIRVSQEQELWFDAISGTRDQILAQGISLLRKRLAGKALTYADGKEYDWK